MNMQVRMKCKFLPNNNLTYTGILSFSKTEYRDVFVEVLKKLCLCSV